MDPSYLQLQKKAQSTRKDLISVFQCNGIETTIVEESLNVKNVTDQESYAAFAKVAQSLRIFLDQEINKARALEASSQCIATPHQAHDKPVEESDVSIKENPHKDDHEDKDNPADDAQKKDNQESLSNLGNIFIVAAAAILIPAVGYAVLSDNKESIKETAFNYIEQIKSVSLDDVTTYIANNSVNAHQVLSSAIESIDTSFAEKAISDLNPYMYVAFKYINSTMETCYDYIEKYGIIDQVEELCCKLVGCSDNDIEA